MQFVGNGLDISTGKLLMGPIPAQQFFQNLLNSLEKENLQYKTAASTAMSSFLAGIEIRRPTVDLADPLSVGWTFLVSGDDPDLNEVIKAVKPLAEHRKMKDPGNPIILRDPARILKDPANIEEWLGEHRSGDAPHYIMIIGSPKYVPFAFQSLLSTAAAVGRADFDSTDDLGIYIRKIIKIEKAPNPIVTRQTIFLSPDFGEITRDGKLETDPTYFSRKYMAEPLAKYARVDCKFETTMLGGQNATKKQFLESIRNSNPALVYTASHGAAVPGPLDLQKKIHGAIVCQGPEKFPAETWPEILMTPNTRNSYLFTADDIPSDGCFLEGSVFFQFACFGYGTPKESDFSHWFEDMGIFMKSQNSEEDFVSAIPKKLLALKHGPVGYIGHLDVAIETAFVDENEARREEPKWLDLLINPRLVPFTNAVKDLLEVKPTGLAMGEIGRRLNTTNWALTHMRDDLRRGRIKEDELADSLPRTFLFRADAANYMIFGDPAVRLRIPY